MLCLIVHSSLRLGKRNILTHLWIQRYLGINRSSGTFKLKEFGCLYNLSEILFSHLNIG